MRFVSTPNGPMRVKNYVYLAEIYCIYSYITPNRLPECSPYYFFVHSSVYHSFPPMACFPFPLPSLQIIFLPPLSHSNPQQPPLGLIPKLHSPKLIFPTAPHLAVSSEAEIRTSAFNQYLTHQHAAAVPHVDAVPAAGIYIAVDIALDPIRGARVRVSENPSVRQVRLIISPVYGVGIYGCCTRMHFGAIAVNDICIGDVARFLIRAKAYPIRSSKTVGHNPDIASRRVEAVDVLRQLGFRTETLLVAINGVCEPNGSVGVDNNVVGGVERAAMIVVYKRDSFVGSFGFHVDEARRFAEGALGAEDDAIAKVAAAVCHVIAFWAADFVPSEVGGGEELDFGDEDGFV